MLSPTFALNAWLGQDTVFQEVGRGGACARRGHAARVMAAKSHFNIYTTYYESFLALSVSIRVDKHQLTMETPSSSASQLAPVLRYRDITFTAEYMKECLSAVCPLLGVHNVARVRQGALPLFEVDFTDEKALEKFCKMLSNGMYSTCMHNNNILLIIVITSQEKSRLDYKINWKEISLTPNRRRK